MILKKCPVGPKRKRTPKRNLEGAVVRECLRYLEDNDDVLYVERRNTGAVELQGGGYIRFGSKGAADIWCLVETYTFYPVHVEIECKRRDGKGRQSKDQKDFQAMCERIGVPYFLVISAEELAKKIDELCS